MGYATDSMYFYILGGQDLNKGLFNTIWRINLQSVRDNVKHAFWEEVVARGEPPRRISHCCMFVYQSKIFVFGGATLEDAPKHNKRKKQSLELDNTKHMFHVLSL